MSNQIKPLQYIPAFDGVRGVFCVLVITHHWVMPFLKGPFSFLWWILQMFFILSGFLITRILLNDKQRFDFKGYAKRFYTRRAYRIFPLYFFYLFLVGGLLLLVGLTEAGAANKDVIYFKENWIYLFTYTYNFTEIINHLRGLEFIPAPLFSHLWSLSIEEQFYMVLPIVIYFISYNNLKRLIIGLIIAGPIIRYIAYQSLASFDPDPHWLGLIAVRNSIFQMDTLAYGMAIAVFDFDFIKRPMVWLLSLLGIWVAMAFVCAIAMVNAGEFTTIRNAMQEYLFITKYYNYVTYFTLTNIMAAAFILAIVRGTVVVKLFENKFFCFLGKISYGMYVYHYFVMLIAAGLIHAMVGSHTKYIGNFPAEVAMYIFYMSLLILVAHLSFKYFESYFLNIKEKK